MIDPNDDLRVLTIRQPWASFVADGRKQWETRTRRTHWRGWVAIHAGVALPLANRCLAEFHGIDTTTMALGRVVALARLVDCCPTDSDAEHPDGDLTAAKWGKGVTDDERKLGDYSPGRFGWKLADVHAFDGPKLKGKLGLFKPTARECAQIFASYTKSLTPKP